MTEANATTSNGEHVFPTVAASEFKGAQAQKDKAGGYVLQRVTGNNGNQVCGCLEASDCKGCRLHSERSGKYALHVFTQVSAGSNPQVCGTLAARDGIKTGQRTPNGQDAYDGKLIVAKPAVEDGLTGRAITGTIVAGLCKMMGNTQNNNLVLHREPPHPSDTRVRTAIGNSDVCPTIVSSFAHGAVGTTQDGYILFQQFPHAHGEGGAA